PHGNPRSWDRGPARRAARAADGRACEPLARPLQRPAAADARAKERRRHADDGRGLLRMIAILNINWQTLADAVGLGSIYALMAVGIGLVFGVLRLVNFAYGQLIMAGAFALAFAYEHGWPVWVGVVLCFGVVVILSVAMAWVVFRPLRGHSPAVMVVATVAV